MKRGLRLKQFEQFKLLAVLVLALTMVPIGHASPEAATITYRHVFKGSTPEFTEIKISDQGKASYDIRQLADDPDPENFEVGPAVRQRIFELAADLKDFSVNDLDVQKQIANLGQKTFRYEHDAEVHEVSFNYTMSAPANQLMQIFEGLAQQQSDMDLLERRARYDRLGINDALRRFESDLDHRLLPEPERVLPVLDQIANDSHFVEIARTRARALAERIRNSHDR